MWDHTCEKKVLSLLKKINRLPSRIFSEKNCGGNCNRLGATSFRKTEITKSCEKLKKERKQWGILVSFGALKTAFQISMQTNFTRIMFFKKCPCMNSYLVHEIWKNVRIKIYTTYKYTVAGQSEIYEVFMYLLIRIIPPEKWEGIFCLFLHKFFFKFSM